MIGGVTRHMLPHLPGVLHLHVNGRWSQSEHDPQKSMVFMTRVVYQFSLYDVNRERLSIFSQSQARWA